MSVYYSLGKVLLNVIFHPVPNLLNEIKIWRIWWLEDLRHLTSFNLSLRFSSFMAWCAILHELKLRMLLKPVIKHRNDMLNISSYIDTALIFFPEYIWSFCCPTEATPKHPTCIVPALLYYTGWIQLFIMSDTDSYSLVYSTLNPCFICP